MIQQSWLKSWVPPVSLLRPGIPLNPFAHTHLESAR